MSFLANPIANISGGIHDLGKSQLGRMAEAAALMYFTGDPEGFLASGGNSLAANMGLSAAQTAGIAMGAVTTLGTGSLEQGLKAGLMSGGLYGLTGPSSIDGLQFGGQAGVGSAIPEAIAAPITKAAELGVSNVPNNVLESAVQNAVTPNVSSMYNGTNMLDASLSETATPLQNAVNPTNDLQASVQAPVANATAPINGATPNSMYSVVPQAPATSSGLGLNPGLGASPSAGLNPTPSNYFASTPPPSASPGFFQTVKNWAIDHPYYAGAAGVAGLAALKAAAKPNTVGKLPDNRRLKFYGGNPYSGAGAMYETPALAASGGIVALANGGDVKKYPDGGPVFVSAGGNEGEGVYMTPSQMASYSADSVYAPAIAALNTNAPAPVASAPTYASFTPTQIKQYFVDNPGANVALATQQFNADPAAVAAALGAPASMASVLAANNAAATPTGIASLPTTTSTAPVSTTAPTSTFSNATLAAAGQAAADRSNAASLLNSFQNPTATQLTDFKKQPTATQNAQIQTAISAATTLYGGNNAQAQAAVAKLMDQWGINPDTVQSALGSSYTGPSVQSLYSAVDPAVASGATPAWANQGAYATPAAAVAAANAVDTTKTTMVDPNAVAASLGLKGTYKSLSDVATALGLPPGNYTSMADITKAITALSVTPKTPVTPAPLTPTAPPVNLAPVVNLAPTTMTAPSLDKNGYYVPATGPTATSNGQTYNAGYISNTANPTTAQGVGGSHAFVDPNGYISQAPAMPFRPIGGYGTLQAAKDAYTKAGGSLGYTNPKAPAVTTEDATQHYLDILSGKAPASKVPYTPNGVIAAPYYSSVMGMPLNPKYEVSQANNPHYDPKFSPSADYIGAYAPGYTGEAAPALDPKTIAYLQGQGANVGTNPTAASASSSALTSTSGAPVTLPNKVTATPLTNYPGYLKGTDGKYYDKAGNKVADTEEQVLALINEVPAANGGLMGLAAGGLGNLGGYSDGGRLLRGPGDGISDSIPATIGARNPQPARLADGEFVVPARIVSELGNGSTEAGARKLYQMMDRVQNARKKTTGKKQVASNPRAEQYLPA